VKRHRQIVPMLVAAAVAATLTGCGGGDDDGGDDFARFSAQDVQKRFEEVTGFPLQRSTSTLGTTTLSLARPAIGDEAARQRYGTFQIVVATDADALERRMDTISSEQTVVVDNVLLRNGYETADGNGFARVSRIVRSLGRPLSALKLPPEDVSCDRAGIDPDGGEGKTGTCLEGAQTVTVVPADGTLVLPNQTVSKPVVRVSRTVTSERYGSARTLRARGQFVAVRTRIENTSNGPFNQPQADLVINGRRYAPDNQDYLLQERLEYQPGERATVTFLFDIPRTAEDPRTGGVLQFADSAENVGSSDRAVAVGRLRLR